MVRRGKIRLAQPGAAGYVTTPRKQKAGAPFWGTPRKVLRRVSPIAGDNQCYSPTDGGYHGGFGHSTMIEKVSRRPAVQFSMQGRVEGVIERQSQIMVRHRALE
jgi:hypothetical protein